MRSICSRAPQPSCSLWQRESEPARHPEMNAPPPILLLLFAVLFGYAGWLFMFRADRLQADYLRRATWTRRLPLLRRIWWDWPQSRSYVIWVRVGGVLCLALAVLFLVSFVVQAARDLR